MVDVARTRRAHFEPGAGTTSGDGSLEAYAQSTIERVKSYAREEPVSFGLWAFGIGFLVGWKLKPW